MLYNQDGTGTIKFSLEWEGQTIALPSPLEIPQLKGYAKTFAACLNGIAPMQPPRLGCLHNIESRRPRKLLSRLALLRSAASEAAISETSPQISAADAGLRHHIALMRAPHFVVRYLAGPPVSYEQMDYAGVFIVDQSVDGAFAKSEPPTHDDWIPDLLEDRADKSVVRVAEKRIQEALEEFTAPPGQLTATGGDLPLGAFSDMLGGLIPIEQVTGASQQFITVGNGGNATPSAVTVLTKNS